MSQGVQIFVIKKNRNILTKNASEAARLKIKQNIINCCIYFDLFNSFFLNNLSKNYKISYIDLERLKEEMKKRIKITHKRVMLFTIITFCLFQFRLDM